MLSTCSGDGEASCSNRHQSLYDGECLDVSFGSVALELTKGPRVRQVALRAGTIAARHEKRGCFMYNCTESKSWLTDWTYGKKAGVAWTAGLSTTSGAALQEWCCKHAGTGCGKHMLTFLVISS